MKWEIEFSIGTVIVCVILHWYFFKNKILKSSKIGGLEMNARKEEIRKYVSDEEYTFPIDCPVRLVDGTDGVVVGNSKGHTVKVGEKLVENPRIRSASVKELYIYPVKSCAGIKLNSAVVQGSIED